MECFLQYLDDLDDFVGMLALAAERVRRVLKAIMLTCVTIGLQVFGVALALTQPPLALAAVSLVAVGILYRAAVNHPVRNAS
jgi:hypothetical protein